MHNFDVMPGAEHKGHNLFELLNSYSKWLIYLAFFPLNKHWHVTQSIQQSKLKCFLWCFYIPLVHSKAEALLTSSLAHRDCCLFRWSITITATVWNYRLPIFFYVLMCSGKFYSIYLLYHFKSTGTRRRCSL